MQTYEFVSENILLIAIAIIILNIALFIALFYEQKNRVTLKRVRELLGKDTAQLIIIAIALFVSYAFFHELGHYLVYLKYNGEPHIHFAYNEYKNPASFLIAPLFYITHDRAIGERENRIAHLNGNFFSVIYITLLSVLLFLYKMWRGKKLEGRFIKDERDYLEIVLTGMLVLFIVHLLINMNPFSINNDLSNMVMGR